MTQENTGMDSIAAAVRTAFENTSYCARTTGPQSSWIYIFEKRDFVEEGPGGALDHGWKVGYLCIDEQRLPKLVGKPDRWLLNYYGSEHLSAVRTVVESVAARYGKSVSCSMKSERAEKAIFDF